MKALTYDEWRAAGFAVKKGETTTGRNRYGEATFTRVQVEPMKSFDNRHGVDKTQLSRDEKERKG